MSVRFLTKGRGRSFFFGGGDIGDQKIAVRPQNIRAHTMITEYVFPLPFPLVHFHSFFGPYRQQIDSIETSGSPFMDYLLYENGCQPHF